MKDSQLNALLTPIVEEFGLELEDIVVAPAGKRRLLRVTVDGDGPSGHGPSLDDIAEATKAISMVLDGPAAMDSSIGVGDRPYTLEVSSRGVSRPLTAPRHWRRNRSRLVTVNRTDGSVVTGRITSSDDAGVDLTVDEAVRRIPYGEVARAVVQVEFNRPTAGASEEEI